MPPFFMKFIVCFWPQINADESESEEMFLIYVIRVNLRLKIQVFARCLAFFRWISLVNAPGFGVRRYCRRHRNERTFGDVNTIAYRCVDSKKCKRLDRAVTGKHDVRRKGNMVLYHAVMTNVIAAPKNDVIANRRERLNRVVFEDKTVVADLSAGEDCRPRANVADKVVSLLFDLVINGFTQTVHAARRHGSEEFEFGRRINGLDIFKGNDRQIFKRLFFRKVLFVHTEGNDLVLTVVLQIELRQLSKVL